jgi:DNA-binding Xre family transcriptional regulator
LMAERSMFSTTELLPLLAQRGVGLSREQVYRLVAKVPERLNLETLAALCDILECSPGDLIEITTEPTGRPSPTSRAKLSDIRPLRAKVARGRS